MTPYEQLALIVAEQKVEIDRLRELKTPATRQLINLEKAMLANAEAEVKELRAALEKIAGYPAIWPATECVDIAHKALASKEGK